MPDLASVLCSLPSFGCLFGYYLHGILQPPIFSPTSPSNSAPFCFDSHSASKLSFPRSGMLARGILSLKPQGYKLVNHFGIGHPGVRSPPCPNQLRPRGPCFRIRPYLASKSCPRLFHRRGTWGRLPHFQSTVPGILALSKVKSTNMGGVKGQSPTAGWPWHCAGYVGRHRLNKQQHVFSWHNRATELAFWFWSAH